MTWWQWQQPDHMQVICTSLQTDNHASTSSLHIFNRPDALPAAQPTASNHWRHIKLKCCNRFLGSLFKGEEYFKWYRFYTCTLSCVCVAMFDRDRSGSIELHEFQSLWSYIGQWRQVFDQYDRDRSGAIDGNELHNSKLALYCRTICSSFKHLPYNRPS